MKQILFMLSMVALIGGIASYFLDAYSSLLFFSIISAVSLIALSSLKSSIGIFSLTTGALIAMTAYSLAVPIHHYYHKDYNEASIIIALVACLIAINSQYIGYLIAEKVKIIFCKKKRYMPISRYYNIGKYILIFGLLSSFLALFLTVGFAAYFEAGYAGRALLKRQAGPVELGLYYIILGIIILSIASYLDDKKKRARLYKISIPLITIFFVVYVSFLGIRRPSFFIVASLFYLYIVINKKHSMAVTSTAIVIFVFFALFANFRQVLSDSGTSESYLFIIENFSWKWFDFSKTELGAPFRALIDVIGGWSDSSLRYGFTYLEALINLPPSSIMKHGDSLSVEYTNRFFSKEYIAIGGNMGFFPVAEAYVNFRIAGIIIEFIIIGFIIKMIEKAILLQRTFRCYLIYAITLPWFFFFVRTDFSSFLKSFFYSIVFPFLLFMLYEKIKSNKDKNTLTQ